MYTQTDLLLGNLNTVATKKATNHANIDSNSGAIQAAKDNFHRGYPDRKLKIKVAIMPIDRNTVAIQATTFLIIRMLFGPEPSSLSLYDKYNPVIMPPVKVATESNKET